MHHGCKWSVCLSQRTLVHKDMSSQTCTKLLKQGMSLWGSLEKDTDRMCPSSPRQTWSSNLNHTASQLFQVASQRADQRDLLWMARKRLGSPSQVGLKPETVAWTPATTLLSLYWFKSLFSPVARTLFRKRKWAVSSPESCVSYKDYFNLHAHGMLLYCVSSLCSLATLCSDYSSAV